MLKTSHLLLMLTIIGLSRPMVVFADEVKAEALLGNIQDVNAVRRVHVRSLAASCVVCHGTGGNDHNQNNHPNKIVGLAGIDSADFMQKMLAFKSGERAATVMQTHAKGLNIQEIADLAEYFSAQAPRKAIPLPAQTLLENHAN